MTGANRGKKQLELWDFGKAEQIQYIDWEKNKSEIENGAFIFAC